MKKLSLLLFAVCASVMSWALNPNTDWNRLNTYVYGMGASLTTNNDTVVLTYKLNSEAVPGGDTYNDINPSSGETGRGIQIYLLYKDEQGEWQRVQKDDGTGDYAFYGGAFKQGDNTAKIPVAGIPTNCKGKELTWEARVHGNVMRTQPTIVGAVTTQPYNAYGIAVNNDPTHKRFAQMYVSEAYPRQYSGWSKHGEDNVYKYANQMLEYTPLLGFQCAHFKHWHDGNESHFASSWNWTQTIDNYKITCTYSHNYEPNRIKVSEDGRIFTSSFHPKAACAVVEYSRGDRDTYNLGHHFYSTIKNNWDYNDDLTNSDAIGSVDNPFLYRRCIGMDVKGEGENLKIILLWIDANACNYKNSNNATVQSAKFEIYEYEIGRAEKNGKSYLDPFDTASGYVHKIGEYDWDYKGATSGGAFYQGARYGVRNETAKTQLLYNNMLRGFADLAYGPNNDVWVKIDYCFSVNSTAQIIRVKLSDGSTTPYTVAKNTTANYGGSGILIKGDLLITSPTDNTICIYQINANGELTATNNIPTAKYTITDNRIGTWVSGFATDFAGNLFSLTQAATNGENYTANVLGIAMPYKTAITTRAKGTFTVTDPVPNILATDLRCDIVRGKNQYEFSFNVNTKPEEAQIRFYESVDAMKNSLNAVNADNYDGTNNNKPVYVYNIPDDKLKQGRIAVTFGAVGGEADANGVITNNRLPAGVLYWSVYVKTRESNVFAPTCRLEGVNDAQGAHRRYATVNNYPETDMFGSFIVADCPTVNSVNGPYNGLMIYGINPDGNSNDEQSDISNGVRYSHRESYLNSRVVSASDKLNFPRRLVVAPDGRVFIADQGTTDVADYAGATSIVQHERGGVRLWDPKDPNKFTLFSHNKIGTSFGVSLWEHSAANGGLKIYASNAYEEYLKHNAAKNYDDQQKDGIFGWNGLAEYTLSAHPNGSANWSNPDSVHYALGRGDASGNYSLVAMDKGIWMCQHREHNRQLKDEALQPLADNLDAVLLSFFPYGSTTTETWNSCTTNGVTYYDDATKRAEHADASDLTQKKTSPIQSTPGAGMAYRKIDGKEYLFVVNHDGNIAQILIDGWTGSGATATPIIDASKVKILVTPAYTKGDRDVDKTSTKWHTAFITTINFDYAGNMVTTTGKSFGQAHDIIVYTMPYDRMNAREIQAPNSCVEIPERIAQLDMTKDNMDKVIEDNVKKYPQGCAVDIYRPLQGGMFNTICLPFELNLGDLPETHPLYGATLREYTGLNLNTIGGEKVLELVFTDVANKTIKANKPYIIQLKDENGYNSIMRFAGPLQLTSTTGNAVQKTEAGGTYSITYQGIIPCQNITPTIVDGESLTLMLVADNRLAEMTAAGDMYGFRGYFTLNKPLPKGMQTRITNSKGTATNTTIVVDGKTVHVEKYLREGRVYIRVGETLYSITGEVVGERR